MLRKKSKRVTIRFDEEEREFYANEAQSKRQNISEYIRHLIVLGELYVNAKEIREDFKYTAAEIQKNWENIQAVIPDEVVLSLFTVEELLKKVVAGKNIQTYYEAQNNAQSRLERVKDTLAVK